jgi:hypothetical protein
MTRETQWGTEEEEEEEEKGNGERNDIPIGKDLGYGDRAVVLEILEGCDFAGEDASCVLFVEEPACARLGVGGSKGPFNAIFEHDEDNPVETASQRSF